MINLPINLLKEVCEKYSSNSCYSQGGVAISVDRVVRFSVKLIRHKHFILNFSAEVPSKPVRYHVARLENGVAQVMTRDGWTEVPSVGEALKIMGGASAGVSPFLERLLFSPMNSIEWSSFEPYEFEISENPSVAIIKGASRMEQETLFIDLKNLCIFRRESYIQTDPSLLSSVIPEFRSVGLDWPEPKTNKPLKTVIEFTAGSFDQLVFPDDFQPITS